MECQLLISGQRFNHFRKGLTEIVQLNRSKLSKIVEIRIYKSTFLNMSTLLLFYYFENIFLLTFIFKTKMLLELIEVQVDGSHEAKLRSEFQIFVKFKRIILQVIIRSTKYQVLPNVSKIGILFLL